MNRISSVELHPIRQDVQRIVEAFVDRIVGIRAGHVVGRRFLGAVAIGVFFGGGRKQLVGDPHFDVVGLGRKHRERLVLRLPAEPRDGAVIAAAVRMAGDTERCALARGGIEVAQNLPILNRIDQAQARHLQAGCGTTDCRP